ncbi:MAG: hypothetical protein AB8H79_00550 [Myxococcota bacterium]
MLALLLGLLTTPALAQDRGARGDDAAFASDSEEEYNPGAKDRLYYSNATFARVNPLGLINIFRVGWRRRLSTKDSLLFKDTYTFAGVNVLTTPANTRVGLYGEAQILAVLRVFGEVNGVGYYGTFDQIMSWDDPNANFSDNTIADRGEQGLSSPTTGWVLNAGGTVRGAAGPVVFRSTAQVTRYDLSLPDGDVVFYDQYWDRLAPDKGWMILNDLDVLVLAGNARVGVRHTFTDQLGGDLGDAGGMAQHRVDPLLAYQFHDKGKGTRFNQPTLFMLVQWWAKHPYRTGAEQPAGLPLIALGFAFNGDLTGPIPSRP